MTLLRCGPFDFAVSIVIKPHYIDARTMLLQPCNILQTCAIFPYECVQRMPLADVSLRAVYEEETPITAKPHKLFCFRRCRMVFFAPISMDELSARRRSCY